jgi:hypothetical protein
LENGRSVRKGYHLKDTIHFSPEEGRYTITFINLVRTKDQSYAGIIATVKQKDDSKPFYVAIPAVNSTGDVDLQTTVLATIRDYNWDVKMKNAFYRSLAEYLEMPHTKEGIGKGWSKERIRFISSQIEGDVSTNPRVQKNETDDRVFTKVEHEAMFPGGAEGWRRFLETNLNANVAADDGAKPGIYTVKLQFIVDKEGNISNVQAIDVPRACPSCGPEGVKVIRKSPKWNPAMQNGRKVTYQAVQFITFQVVKG